MAYCPATLGAIRRAAKATAIAPSTRAAQRQPTSAAPRMIPARQPVTRAGAQRTAQAQATRKADTSASRQRAAATTTRQKSNATAVRQIVTRAAAASATPHRQPSTPGQAEVKRAQQILRTPNVGRTATVQRSAARGILRRAKSRGVSVLPGTSSILRDAAASGPITPAVTAVARQQAARMDTSTGQGSVPSVEAATAPTPQEAAMAAAFGTGQPDANVTAEAGNGGVMDGIGGLFKNPVVLLGVAAVAFFAMKKKGRK